MSENSVIRLEGVSKRFVFTPETPKSLFDAIISFFSRRRRQDLWAVRDVSLEAFPGQAIGIVGRNGSGKSTLLKLISRILRPNEGRLTINGRTSALLELGAGFHVDLTGRENIFLNASVLGLSKEEIAASYDDIVAFSELGEYIDMPVKHYSSGMYMRLGFSVAIHVKPDILIVDEILAVGDQPFQTKCFDRIYEMNRQGTTIIMVSHNLGIMRKLCSHLIWLENGRMRESGPTEIVAAQYQASSYEREGKQLADRTAVQTITRRGSGEMEITAVRFLNADEKESNSFISGEAMTIEMDYIAHAPINEPEFGFSIFRQDGIHVTGPNNLLSGFPTGVIEGMGTIQYCIEKLPLLPALYQVTAAIHNSRSNQAYDVHDQAYSFRVNPGGTEEMFGLLELPAQWRLKPVGAVKSSQRLLEL